jgi:hypothetical protein
MTSWRQTASSQTQSELDGLVSTALDLAQQQLTNHGEFYPFGLVVDLDAVTRIIDVTTVDVNPSSRAVIERCRELITCQRAAIRASAVCADVQIKTAATDAIQVDLEHADGIALTIVLPYTKRRRNKIDYGQLRASTGEHRIWSPPNR